MKNFIWIMAIVLLLFSMFGCGSKSHYWEPLYPVDHVKEIRIIDVNLIGDSVDAEEDYTLIKDMDPTDFDSIFDDIQTIDYKQLGPSPATPYGTSIMILYESGEYEIVATGMERTVFIPIPKKGNAKNVQTITQLHSSHMLAE